MRRQTDVGCSAFWVSSAKQPWTSDEGACDQYLVLAHVAREARSGCLLFHCLFALSRIGSDSNGYLSTCDARTSIHS